MIGVAELASVPGILVIDVAELARVSAAFVAARKPWLVAVATAHFVSASRFALWNDQVDVSRERACR